MGSLKQYREKRVLSETPEPGAGIVPRKKGKELIFVVQKHHARRLHYDFRLEVNGVLKSWAIPKGPSMNPADKRLAIMVEDHPYDYRDFEGNIPKGHYGAGAVMVWDEGTYLVPNEKNGIATENEIENDLKKGHLTVILNGKKLKGEFSLVQLKNVEDGNHWLLIKKKDKYATTKDITQLDRSAKTDRTIDQIADKDSVEISQKKTAIPKRISPMLAVLGNEPFNRNGWIFENKWDGFRAIAQIEKGKVLLYSRNGLSFNERFASIVEELSNLPVVSAVLDGEVVILDKKGKSQFQMMQNYQRQKQGNLFYYVFDLIYLNGYDLRKLELIKRKALLEKIIEAHDSPHIRFSEHVEEKGIPFFKKALKKHSEGVMAKRSDSTYQMRRSDDWVKIKTHLRQEVVIGGYTQPKGSRQKFGALLVGVYEGKALKFIGRVGGGFNQKLLSEVYSQMQPLIQSDSPFINPPKPRENITWLKPKLVCEVSFAEWTSENILRQPIFKGMRVDKVAKDVKKEV